MIDRWKDLELRWNHCCSPEIPTVFGEEWSYYERVCKLIKYLDDTMYDVNLLKEYVENYFTNLDVQDEINNKINEMVADGTFPNLIARYFPEYEINLRKYLNAGMNFTQALNQAITDCPTFGSIFIPNGNYTYEGTLKITKPISIRGDIYGVEPENPTTFITFTGNPAVNITTMSVKIENLSIFSNAGTSTNQGTVFLISAPANRYNILKNLYISANVYTNGIYMGPSLECRFENIRIERCRNGFTLVGETHNNDDFIQCWVNNYYNFAYEFENYFYGSLINCNADSIDAQNNSAYYIKGAENMVMDNCSAEGTGVSALRIENASQCRVMLFSYNNKHSAPDYGVITVSNTSNLILIGCTTKEDQNIIPAVVVDNLSTLEFIGTNFVKIRVAGNEVRVKGYHSFLNTAFNYPASMFAIENGTINDISVTQNNGTTTIVMDYSYTAFSTFLTPPNTLILTPSSGITSEGGWARCDGVRISITNPNASGRGLMYIVV